MNTNFKKYKNCKTGEIIMAIFQEGTSLNKSWGYKWRLTQLLDEWRTTHHLFETKADFKKQYKEITNDK